MNFPLYEHAKAQKTKGYEFQGRITREAVESVLRQYFRRNEDLAEECRRWGEGYFGRGAFGGANVGKWKFIQYLIPSREQGRLYPDEVDEADHLVEGAVRPTVVNAYERNPKARAACVAHYGTRCHVCTLDFSERYGELGQGFIHVHHLRQIARIKREYEVDPIKDLRPVCPNCHAMLHRKKAPLGIEELKKLLRG
jgi:hypothetical protein